MSFYPFIELVAGFIVLFSALIFFWRNPYENLYKIFSAALATIALAIILEFFLMVSQNYAEAVIVKKISDCAWAFAIALLLHAMLLFNNSLFLKERLNNFLIYLPSLIFSLIFVFFDFTYRAFVNTPLGITYIPNLFYFFFIAFAGIYVLISIGLLHSTYITTNDPLKKHQALFLEIAFIIPLVFGIVIELFAYLFKIILPPYFGMAIAIGVGFVMIATERFKLFPKYPEIAAESIFANLPDILLVTDIDNKINLVNASFLKLVGIEQSDSFLSLPLSQVIENDEAAKHIVNKVLKKNEVLYDYLLTFKNKIFSVNAAQVRDWTYSKIGMVIIGRDVTERKANEEELRKSTVVLERNLKEIDRINQLLVDRELEMITLRNEITTLKAKLAHG
jgi:PAS domain S-box-containing protein